MTAEQLLAKDAALLMKNCEILKNIPHDNVYLPGIPENRKIIGAMVERFMLPTSGIVNAGNLRNLYEKALKGESCIILGEHYSNFDYPALFRLIEKDPLLGPDVAQSFLPIQGAKLSNSAASITTPFSLSYDTIVIFPSRALDKITDPEELAEIRRISTPMNHLAMKHLIEKKHQGRMILVFPAGTRYRPWDPDSKKGVREIYSYLKNFDNVVFMAINGNCLVPDRSDDMAKDILTEDVLLFSFSEAVSGRDYRNDMTEKTPEGEDPRQFVVDQVMSELDKLHEASEKIHQERLRALGR
jgi:glycerol-3-phosphate O-acyltransferase